MAAGVTVVPASGRPLTGLSEEFPPSRRELRPDLQRRGGVPALRPRAHLCERCLDTRLAAELVRRLEQLDIVATFFANGQGYASQRQLALPLAGRDGAGAGLSAPPGRRWPTPPPSFWSMAEWKNSR